MENRYLIQYGDYENSTIKEFEKVIKETKGIPCKGLTMANLTFHDNEPIVPAMGVYIFKEGDDIIYVGKCSARCFIERIPAHLDLRNGGWFNSLLRAIKKKKYKEEIPNHDYTFEKEAKEVLENYSLILINFSYEEQNHNMIEHVEDLLRCRLDACNGFKGKRFYDLDLRLKLYNSKHDLIQ